MRAMSYIRAWVYGVSGFVAATASLTVAMTIAISGPPTAAEMQALQAMAAHAAADLAPRIEQLGADVCDQLPEALFCEDQSVATAEDPPPPPEQTGYIDLRPPHLGEPTAVGERPAEEAAPHIENQDLLGGGSEVASQRVNREARQTRNGQSARRDRASRAQVDRARRASRAAPRGRARVSAPPARPSIVARQDPIPTIPDNAVTSPLEELLASTEELLAQTPAIQPEPAEEQDPEGFDDPPQGALSAGRDDDAAESIAEAWAAPRDDRRVEDAAYEEEPYRETYEEYRARRRAERAAQRREEERRYREQYWPPPPPYRRW